MNITPRATEVQAVVALLESDEYEDGPALAKAIIKTVHTEMEKRDQYAALYRFSSGSPTIAYGPFSGEGEAAKFLTKMVMPKPAQMLELKLYSVAEAMAQDAKHLKAAQPTWCTDCYHPTFTHQTGSCAVGWCSCKSIKKGA